MTVAFDFQKKTAISFHRYHQIMIICKRVAICFIGSRSRILKYHLIFIVGLQNIKKCAVIYTGLE